MQVVSFAEALTWVECSGLNSEAAVAFLNKCAPHSGIPSTVTDRMTRRNYQVDSRLRLMAKDLRCGARPATRRRPTTGNPPCGGSVPAVRSSSTTARTSRGWSRRRTAGSWGWGLARRRRLGTASSHKPLTLDGSGKYGDKTESPAAYVCKSHYQWAPDALSRNRAFPLCRDVRR